MENTLPQKGIVNDGQLLIQEQASPQRNCPIRPSHVTIKKLGIVITIAGIIMVLNIEVAFLTPPFGVNLFVSSAITGKGIVAVTRAVFPYLFLIWGVLFLITYVPWISLVLTRLIL